MSRHHNSSDQVLSMVVEQAIYPITVDVLYSIFGPFGVEQLVVYPPTKSDEGEPCVAAGVRFSSAHAAAHTMAYWDGRYIYYRCCRLQMWNVAWNATTDIRPAPTSPPTRTAAPDPPSPLPSEETTTEESAPVPDVSCPTTKGQEVLELIPDTSPAYLARAPVTCSTDGSRQVAATIVYPDPAVDINNKELEQLTPARATPSIDIGTYSIAEEVVPPMATTTDVDPKDGVQELDALSVNTSTPVTNKVDHGVTLIIPNDLAARTLTGCSMKFSLRDTSHLKSVLHPAVTPSSPTAIVDTFPDQIAMLGNDTKDIVLPTQALQADELQWQPWPPPLRLWIRHVGCLFKPRLWPSLKYDSIAGYPEEPCSGTRRQPQEVSGFNVGLVWLQFRDVGSPQVSYRRSNSMEESLCCLPGAKLQSGCPPDHATTDANQSKQASYSLAVVQETYCIGTFLAHAGHLTCFGPEAIPRETTNYKGIQFYPGYIVHSQRGTWLLRIELESYTMAEDLLLLPTQDGTLSVCDSVMHILADSESMAYACLAWIPHGFASSRSVTSWLMEYMFRPRALPVLSQQLMLLLDNVNFTVAEGVSVISSMQSSYEIHTQVQQASCTSMFAVSTELQSDDGTKLRQRPWPLFECNKKTI